MEKLPLFHPQLMLDLAKQNLFKKSNLYMVIVYSQNTGSNSHSTTITSEEEYVGKGRHRKGKGLAKAMQKMNETKPGLPNPQLQQ